MPHKRILFRSAARERILRGAATLADAVRVTLGPRSKCVPIGRPWGAPLVCNDGVTIVKEIELEDPEENLGARMLREAAERTGDVVGDGTTTATLLAHAIFAEGLRNLAAGASGVDLKRGSGRPGGFRPRASLRTGLVGHTSGSLGSGLSGRTMLSGQRPVQPTCVGFTGAEIARCFAVRYVQQGVSAAG